jgi:hypothetical protein
MVLILVICRVSILNCMESICSIGSGSGGAGLPHCLILTINHHQQKRNDEAN